ncbi:hypothetical protein Misp01_65940 [Microtetraspora sp. NBRC 13810]|uniref:hypothetical protein n=1 Tax=Microtetraspora sp. NBRC 13810 TaxID=3030990 RepID=UPI0024A5866B|nr:hypothetical protein [Microtetraspora sp. NBRC 13810]GLW11466.1 hypothetical protein Misp01_65940 [Microtetraspora sp. NBRC 13810]
MRAVSSAAASPPGRVGEARAGDGRPVHVSRPVVRAMRATVFAVVCVLLSAVLHAMVAGGPVHPVVLAGAAVPTWALAFALGGRQRGRVTLLAACFAVQYGLHFLFASSEGVLQDPLLGGSHQHGGGLGMLLIHVAVALLSSWWLERGETALATMLHLAVTPVRRLLAALLRVLLVPVAHLSPARPSIFGDPAPLTSLVLAAAIRRRGPPVVVSAI